MGKFRKFLILLKGLFFVAFNKRKWGPFTQCFLETRFDHSFTVSWSQCGEDVVLDSCLPKSKQGFYIDVGAHHPSRFSVTRHLYERGWSGINLDANSSLQRLLERERPRDTFISAAIGKKDSYQLFKGDELAVSTVNLEWKAESEKLGMVYTQSEIVSGQSLKQIMSHEACPYLVDFLNVDIEGSDYEAIESIELETLKQERWPSYI